MKRLVDKTGINYEVISDTASNFIMNFKGEGIVSLTISPTDDDKLSIDIAGCDFHALDNTNSSPL